jgi:hypothetical protein
MASAISVLACFSGQCLADSSSASTIPYVVGKVVQAWRVQRHFFLFSLPYHLQKLHTVLHVTISNHNFSKYVLYRSIIILGYLLITLFNLTTFMCQLSWNLGASASWNPQGLSRPKTGLLALHHVCIISWKWDIMRLPE